MKLVMLLRTSTKYRATILPLSKRLHTRNLNTEHAITVGPGGEMDLDISTPVALNKAMRRVCDKIGDEQFVLSQDNIFPIALFDPFVVRSRKLSNFQKRKGIERDAMVNTISYLIDHGSRVLDHEIDVPQVFDSGKLDAMLSSVDDMNVLLRTTYFNLYHPHPVRYDDPHIELWTHFMDPETDIVSLSDTCYRHTKCMLWLKKKAYAISVPTGSE